MSRKMNERIKKECQVFTAGLLVVSLMLSAHLAFGERMKLAVIRIKSRAPVMSRATSLRRGVEGDDEIVIVYRNSSSKKKSIGKRATVQPSDDKNETLQRMEVAQMQRNFFKTSGNKKGYDQFGSPNGAVVRYPVRTRGSRI